MVVNENAWAVSRGAVANTTVSARSGDELMELPLQDQWLLTNELSRDGDVITIPMLIELDLEDDRAGVRTFRGVPRWVHFSYRVPLARATLRIRHVTAYEREDRAHIGGTHINDFAFDGSELQIVGCEGVKLRISSVKKTGEGVSG